MIRNRLANRATNPMRPSWNRFPSAKRMKVVPFDAWSDPAGVAPWFLDREVEPKRPHLRPLAITLADVSVAEVPPQIRGHDGNGC